MKRRLPFGRLTVVSPHFLCSLIKQQRKGKRRAQTELFTRNMWEPLFFFLRHNTATILHFALDTRDLTPRGLKVDPACDSLKKRRRLGYLFPAASQFCHVCNSLSSTNECMDKSLSWLVGGETARLWLLLCKI